MPFNLPRHTLSVRISSLFSSPRSSRCIAAAAFLLLASTDGLQNAVANGDTRTLSLHHTHSGEDLTVTFKRDGRYDDDGLAKLNYFLRDWRNHDQTKMDPRLFDVVWEVYQDVGGKAPVQIISAYRSPVTNAMLHRRSKGVAEHSQHTLGRAMDFFIPGVSLESVRHAGLRLQRGGVGFYPSSGSPFVHLDVGGVRHWPRMSRDQLVRVFPTGRTVHLPTDGRPMSGYALALADLERRGSSMPSRLSLAAAQSAGAVSADPRIGAGPKRSLLATLFGAREDEDDKGEGAGPAPSLRVKTPEAVGARDIAGPAKPALAAAAIPLPRVRPAAAPERAPLTVVASAAPSAGFGAAAPAPAAPAAIPSPAEVVQSRGLWRGTEVAAAAEAASAPAAAAPPSRRERMVWQVGAQPAGGATTTIGKTAAQPTAQPARRRIELASASPETTGSLPQWPGETAEDRAAGAPSKMVLAYAEPTADRSALRAAPAPMGTMRAAAPAGRPASSGKTAAAARPFGQLVDKPWLRGVMLSPSIHTAMGVAIMGTPNLRDVAQLMHKPTTVVAIGFSAIDTAEPAAETFSGPAVAFVPTQPFGRITVGLN